MQPKRLKTPTRNLALLPTLILSHGKKVSWLVPTSLWKGSQKVFGISADLKVLRVKTNWRKLCKRQPCGAPSSWMFKHKNKLAPIIYPKPAKLFARHSNQRSSRHFDQNQGHNPAGLHWLWFSSLANEEMLFFRCHDNWQKPNMFF